MVRADFPTPGNGGEKGGDLSPSREKHGYIPGVRKKRMTYHHRQQPPAYILLKTEPRERDKGLSRRGKRGGVDGLLTFWMEKREKKRGFVVGERWKREKERAAIYKGRKTDSDEPERAYDRSRHASSLGHPRTDSI
jgi:hypothetical protein